MSSVLHTPPEARVEIDWRKWTSIECMAKTTLCIGEERRLTAAEIAEINASIQVAYDQAVKVKALFASAQERWASRSRGDAVR